MECVKDGRYNKLDFYEAMIIVNDLHNIILKKLVINQTFQKNMDQRMFMPTFSKGNKKKV
jgi:hypothetical protein